MSDPTGLADMTKELFRLSRLLDQGLDFLRTHANDLAESEHLYRKARALAWQQVEGLAKAQEDAVNALTADERQRRDTAEHMRQAAMESVRSRRVQVTALQTLINAHRGELELSRYGPREGAA